MTTLILLPLRRLLVSLSTVWAATGCTSEKGVIALLEEGKLRAFDIRRRVGRRGARGYLRFYVPTLIDYLEGRQRNEDCSQVIARIFPGTAPEIAGTNIARALSCSAEHVKQLVLNKELAGRRKQQRGSNACLHITRESLTAFLRNRWL